MTRHYFISTALAVLIGVGGLTVVRAVEPTQPALTKKELKAAITNAKTPQDHQRIAAYYQREADRMLAEAKEHDELAVLYGKSPNPLAIRVGKSAEHCKYFAEAARKAAQESKEMEKLHQEMAKQAQ
jgi:acyl-CoA reductase-like NAD-dependent aldehyde dehydrogenase